MHQRRKLTLCLVAGVLVLAVSAAAALAVSMDMTAISRPSSSC